MKDNIKINLKKTWKYIKTAKLSLICYGIVSILETIISTILPLVSAKAILNLTNGIIDQLILSTLLVFIINAISHIMNYLKSLSYRKIYSKTVISIQESLAREILNLEISEIDKNSSGLFIDRLNKDTQDIASLFMEYTYWISHIITNVGVLFTIFILNKYLFIYSVFSSVSVFLINRKRIKKQYEVQKELKILQENKTGLTSELVRGIRDVKVLNASNAILKQTNEKIEETMKKEVKMINIKNFYNYLEKNVRSILDFCFILIGSYLYTKSALTIPTFLIIYNYQAKVKSLLTGVVQLSEYNKKFSISANRIFEVIDNDTFKKEQFGDINIKKLEGNIIFKNVSFGYDKKEIIKNMSFEIKPNERIAFVGKSGAGKTTIFSLITRLYKTNKGKILLDGNNINDLTCSTIRDNMSIITQDPYIFNFSIKENLLMARENATMREIRHACKMACIDDYIMSLPLKYDTLVGENGVILSGGQKQRIAIARALLMKTKIILFDEATSALDNETQSKIQEAINNLKGEYTILIVAHRLSTIIDSDKIFVVEDGKIVDMGTHKELLKTSKIYKNLYSKDLEK